MLHLALDHPVLEIAGPVADPIERVEAVAVLPVAEQLGDAAGREMLGGIAHHGLHDRVADHAAVAVVVLGNALAARGDHERRVRHDAIEPLAGDRFVEAPEPELDAVDAVQQRR